MSLSLVAFRDRFDQLQREEIYDAEAVADYAAQVVGEARLEHMKPRLRGDWIYRSTAFLRGRFMSWRAPAMELAIQSVHDTILAGDVGAMFSNMQPEKRLAIARTLARAAIGAHQGYLEGTVAILPGEYLRNRNDAALEER